MKYCAVIGDIVGSKKLKEQRNQVQEKFKDVISKVNNKYSQYIESKFTITLGDEFQGLLNDASISYEIIQYIKENMMPVNLVFGVGIGTMETTFSKDISIGSDGPVYHYARKMCERAKKKKPSICYYSDSFEDELINSTIYLIESSIQRRTAIQLEVVKLYKEGKTQNEISKILEKDQSTISRILKNSFYDEVRFAEKQIIEVLAQKLKQNNIMYL